LHRSRRNRVLGGVAAGVGETYGIDAALVRVLWVLAALAGFGVPLYVVAWIALPYGDDEGVLQGAERTREISLAVGLGLIALGVFVAFDRVWPGRPHIGHITWPLFLILGGLAILVLRRSHDDDRPAETPAPPSPASGPPPPVASAPITAPTEPAAPGAATTSPDASPGPGSVPPPPTWPSPPTAPGSWGVTPPAPPPPPPTSSWTQTGPWPTPPRPPRPPRPRERAFLTPLALSVLLIGGGVVALLDAVDAVEVNVAVVLAGALAFAGVVLIVSAFAGRARGLIAVGILLGIAAVATSALAVPLHGGWGDRAYHPTARSELEPEYRMSGGNLQLDLRDVPLENRTTRVAVTMGFGHMEIDVPTDVRVVVHARASAGSIDLFGHQDDGLHVDTTRVADGTQPGVLRLELRVGAGRIEVRRFDAAGDQILSGSTKAVAA
jgi:phage shock protein PspC (stress-responsive transcriptional regulator)